MKNIFFKQVALFSLLIVTGIVTSCSGSDDGENITPGGTTLKNYKYTITVDNPIDNTDYISFAIAAGGTQENTIWKVNNVTRTGEQSLGFGRNEFTAGTNTYVIESIQPLRMNAFGVQIVNFGSDIKFSVKVEVDGQTVLNENQILTGDGSDFSRDYTF